MLVTETRTIIPHAHTLANNGTFWFHFAPGLSVGLREQKDHDSIFKRGRFWGSLFVRTFCIEAGGSGVQSGCAQVERMRVGSEACHLKRSLWRSGSSLVSSGENSADVDPLTDNSRRIPSEGTAGWEWKDLKDCSQLPYGFDNKLKRQRYQTPPLSPSPSYLKTAWNGWLIPHLEINSSCSRNLSLFDDVSALWVRDRSAVASWLPVALWLDVSPVSAIAAWWSPDRCAWGPDVTRQAEMGMIQACSEDGGGQRCRERRKIWGSVRRAHGEGRRNWKGAEEKGEAEGTAMEMIRIRTTYGSLYTQRRGIHRGGKKRNVLRGNSVAWMRHANEKEDRWHRVIGDTSFE